MGLRGVRQASRATHESEFGDEAKEGAVMSDDQQREEEDDFNEDGPGINSSLASWFYVLGGIPMMILFFVVLFTSVGSCDAQNIMIYG